MTDQANTTTQHAEAAYGPLQFDPDIFREYVREMDLSLEQQNALLEAVWLVVVGVIDIGFGTHVQDSGSKPLAIDSSSVLTLLSTSNIPNAKDAKAIGPNARRMDS